MGGVSYIHFFGMFLTLQIPFHSIGPSVLIEHRCSACGSTQSAKLDPNLAVIIGTGEHSRKVMLKPI